MVDSQSAGAWRKGLQRSSSDALDAYGSKDLWAIKVSARWLPNTLPLFGV